MIIVSNITGGNTISFIPRQGTESFLERVIADGGTIETSPCINKYISAITLTDEVTGDTIVEYPTFLRLGYLTQCTIESDLKNQRRYLMSVSLSDDEEIYRDLIFCSTQSVADYSISNGELNTESAPVESTPQFIILD